MPNSNVFSSALNAIKSTFSGEPTAAGDEPLAKSKYESLFKVEPSFCQFLPFVDYSDEVFYLDDDVSVASLFELQQSDVEGRPKDMIEQMSKSITAALATLPEIEGNPWVLQVYHQDEPITSLVSEIAAAATPSAKESKMYKLWVKELEEHIAHVSNPKGLFFDERAGIVWSGRIRKIRCCLYRKVSIKDIYDKQGALLEGVAEPADENRRVTKAFLRSIEQSGINHRKLDDFDLWAWLFPWFTPNPTGYDNAYDCVRRRAEARDNVEEEDVAGDISSSFLLSSPLSTGTGDWKFGNQFQRFLSIAPIDVPPVPGAISLDLSEGTNKKAVSAFDQLPAGSIFCQTIVIEAQTVVRKRCADIVQTAGVNSYKADEATEQAKEASHQIMQKQKVYRMFSGVYVKALSIEELEDATLEVETILAQSDLLVLDHKQSPLAGDSFVRNLPGVYDFALDRTTKRARLTYAKHIARLIPLYGKSSGSGNLGLLFFNRSGGPINFNPLSSKDRVKTSHGLIFGNTGAGKSALINYMAIMFAALQNPRIFIIEKGGSFKLLAKYFRYCGKTVNYLKFTSSPKLCPSIPPYAATSQVIKQFEDEEISINSTAEVLDFLDAEEESEDDEQRYYFGEMISSTLMMISDANEQVQNAMSSSRKQVISECLKQALYKAVKDGHVHARPSDVVAVMEMYIAKPPVNEKGDAIYSDEELRDLRVDARSLRSWTEGLKGLIFDRIGDPFVDADLTVVDMAILTNSENKALLAVAMIALINTITGIGEKNQYNVDNRQTVVFTDEGHVLTTNPVITKPLVFGVKTWRKIQIWLIQATQNMSDYPDDAAKMLNLAEWWYLLKMSPAEVSEMKQRFRPNMTLEEERLCVSATKQSRAFVEGVLLSDNQQFLFRSVVPAIALTLAATDGNEKIAHAKIKEEFDVDDVSACLEIAKQMKQIRAKGYA